MFCVSQTNILFYHYRIIFYHTYLRYARAQIYLGLFEWQLVVRDNKNFNHNVEISFEFRYTLYIYDTLSTVLFSSDICIIIFHISYPFISSDVCR